MEVPVIKRADPLTKLDKLFEVKRSLEEEFVSKLHVLKAAMKGCNWTVLLKLCAHSLPGIG
jgi:hypothetical protein